MELEVEKISLELQRVRLDPGDMLVIKVPDEVRTPETVERILKVVQAAFERAGLKNQVLVMPHTFELSAVSG